MTSIKNQKYPFLFTILLLLSLFLLTSQSAFTQQVTSYNEAISKADQLFNNQNYNDAKGYYQMALKYKADDAYAKGKITEIVEKMKGRMAQEEEYYKIIDVADVYFEENDLVRAKTEYNKALQVMPGDNYATRKINEIESLKTVEKERLEAYESEMAEGKKLLDQNNFDDAMYHFSEAQSLFPDKKTPAEQIKLTQQLKSEYENNLKKFNQEINEADRYLLIKDYATALLHYENAQLIFPADKDLLSKIKKIKPEAESQRKYNEIVALADEYYISKDLLNAQAKYSEALKIRPEDSYPKDMIDKINEQLTLQRKDIDKNYTAYILSGDSLFDNKEYTQAKGSYAMALSLKPNETYPASKIKSIDDLLVEQRRNFEKNYAGMIANADNLFKSGQLIQAKEQYELALTIKPEDEYPKQKITDIDIQLAQLAELEKANNQYNELIAEGDRLYNNQQYDLAIKKYTEAQAMKSMENYPKQRIDEINTLLLQARKQQEIEEKYGNQIIVALRLFNEDKLIEAKEAYTNALLLKPDEQLPKDQIIKIDGIFADREKAAEINAHYQVLLKSGDSLQEIFMYDDAINKFQQAGQLKPGDEIAAQRIAKAKVIKVNYEREQSINKAYAEAISNGDKYFEENNYELANIEFKKAIELKPLEIYPKNQVAQIESILVKMEAEKQQRYDEAITKADNFFDQGNFQEAVIQYKVASSILPDEQYPMDRIAECNSYIAEKQRKAKEAYDIAIADADKLYAAKIYDKAVIGYQDAESIKPDETYPSTMIKKITKLIEDNAIVDVINQKVIINSGVEQSFNFEPIKIAVRKSNYVLVKARSISGEPVKIIFNYGSKNTKNGGFVVQVPKGEEFNDFIVRVGNQYKWFSEDNDWISIYPENGDLEISLVRISTSD